MPSKNHGKKMRPTGAFSTPSWLLLVELLHSTCAKTMRRTQSLELSAAYYSRFPPRCGRESAIFLRWQILAKHLLPWKGQPDPLFHTVATRRNVTRRDHFLDSRRIFSNSRFRSSFNSFTDNGPRKRTSLGASLSECMNLWPLYAFF